MIVTQSKMINAKNTKTKFISVIPYLVNTICVIFIVQSPPQKWLVNTRGLLPFNQELKQEHTTFWGPWIP